MMMPLRGALSPLGVGRGAAELSYLLRDEFTTDDAAPITNPRTCEPGPGTLTFTDTGNRLSVASGALISSASAINDPKFYSSAISRACGVGVVFRVNKTLGPVAAPYLGFSSSTTPSYSTIYGVLFNGNSIGYVLKNGVLTTIEKAITRDIYYNFFVVLRGAGNLIILDNKLIYVQTGGAEASLYVAAGTTNAGQDPGKYDYIRAGQFSGGFESEYGIATNRVASPAVGETITQEADALVEMTWTAVTGETWELSTRRTDDDNRWIVRCDQAGSTIKLIQKESGTETERSSAAQTWTNGTSYRLLIILEGNSIKTFVENVPKNTYASATFNNTVTGVKTDRAGSNLIAWPCTLSGAALAELQRWTA